MSTTTTVTPAQADAALAAVRSRFRSYTEPLVIDGRDYGPSVDAEPVLVWDYTDSGHPAICWEEGPDDWAYRMTTGGYSEAEHALAVEAAAEFGAPAPAPRQEDAAVFPPGVYAEPVMSFVLGLYPA